MYLILISFAFVSLSPDKCVAHRKQVQSQAAILTRIQVRRNSISVKASCVLCHPYPLPNIRYASEPPPIVVYKDGGYVMKLYSLFLKLSTVTPRAVTIHTIESPIRRFHSFA